MNYCFPKEGDSSKPSISYRMHAAIQSVCNARVLKYALAAMVAMTACLAYYLYLDKLYLVDEVLQGTRLRELAMAEKITVRVVAPRNIDSLNKFVLDLSVCQAVHEIQILWPHESPRPPDSYFKYPHTHSVVIFVETYGKNTWETLYGQVKISTDGERLR